MEKTFVKVRSIKDIAVSAALLISGFILILIPSDASVNIFGFILIMTGIILSLTLKSGYEDMETRQRYFKKEHYFTHAMNAAISKAISCRPESVKLTEEDKGNAVRLDIYYNRRADKAYIQMFEYVPYKYEPRSEMYEYEISKVAKLIK